MRDISEYDFQDIDKELFRDMSRQMRQQEREGKRSAMVNREVDPVDKNFFEMYQGREVWLKSPRHPAIIGKVRLSFERDAYVVENDKDGVITMNVLRPGLKIGSDKPMIFDIMKPNHNTVFLTEKAMDLSSVDFIINHAKRTNIPLWDLLKQVETMIEKYPEDFI